MGDGTPECGRSYANSQDEREADRISAGNDEKKFMKTLDVIQRRGCWKLYPKCQSLAY